MIVMNWIGCSNSDWNSTGRKKRYCLNCCVMKKWMNFWNLKIRKNRNYPLMIANRAMIPVEMVNLIHRQENSNPERANWSRGPVNWILSQGS